MYRHVLAMCVVLLGLSLAQHAPDSTPLLAQASGGHDHNHSPDGHSHDDHDHGDDHAHTHDHADEHAHEHDGHEHSHNHAPDEGHTHDHDSHDHDMSHDHHHSDDDGKRANTVMADGVAFNISPLIDATGTSQLLVQSDCANPDSLTLTSPSGASYEGNMLDCSSTLISFDFADGIWTLASDNMTTPISMYGGTTDQGSDIRVVFAPAPALGSNGRSEVFVTAFAGGDNIHKRYTVQREMVGMIHMTDDDVLELEHRHYDDFVTDSFEPVSNSAPIEFLMTGIWQLDVMLEGGINEQASFEVEVLDD
ncbi:MAG: hypothetical protein AAF267_06875 [Deinococcota bacterium]